MTVHRLDLLILDERLAVCTGLRVVRPEELPDEGADELRTLLGARRHGHGALEPGGVPGRVEELGRKVRVLGSGFQASTVGRLRPGRLLGQPARFPADQESAVRWITGRAPLDHESAASAGPRAVSMADGCNDTHARLREPTVLVATG